MRNNETYRKVILWQIVISARAIGGGIWQRCGMIVMGLVRGD